MPPILVHRAATGEVEELGAGGLPLGSRLPSRLEERRLALRSGDTLLFASDGFAELLDPEGRELGYDGVADAFRAAARTAGAREVVDRLAAAAGAFRGARPQEDDVTFFVVRVEAAGGTSP
jgi:sigma-B regulation protein RsbU (phosphoserine phosphatase)